MVPQAVTVDPKVYRVGPGDFLSLLIWGPISRSFTLEVGPEGQVFVPSFGSLRIAGLTLSAARQRLEALVASQYRGVRVEVQLQRVRSLLVYLTGMVTQPGPVTAYGSSRLADLLGESRLAAGASRRNIELRHLDGTQETVDLERFNRTGERDTSTWLRDGDVIYVPPRLNSVGIWGGVASPGSFELGREDSLRILVRLAGGFTPAALRDRALFVRWASDSSQVFTFASLPDIESGAFNPALLNGDQFFVFVDPDYRDTYKVTVVGQVQRAGNYLINLGVTRISDVISAAGGFREDADRSSIQLVRVRPFGERSDPEFDRLSKLSRESMTNTEYDIFRMKLAALSPEFRVDWQRLQRGGAALDPLLEDGDVIRVNRVFGAVRVDGQVRNPGLFLYSSGSDYRHYIQLAGGLTSRSAGSRVIITRAASGQAVQARNVREMTPGDFVWVPERRDVTLWDHLRDVLLVAGSVATIYIAYRR